MTAPADWQLPPGVSRGVWDYLHDSSIAQGYDESLTGTPLLEQDLQFVNAHLPESGWILDLGCGTGRAAVPLAKRGYSVVAVDLSAEMLRVCLRKSNAASASVHCLQANIASLETVRENAFDAVLCLFSTLGMIASAKARTSTLECAFRALRPGGVIIVHGHNRWHQLRTRAGRRWLLRDLMRSMRGSPSAGDAQMPHAPGRAGWTMHLFTRGELVRLLVQTGFVIQAIETVGMNDDATLSAPRIVPALRAYGFLIAARRPA